MNYSLDVLLILSIVRYKNSIQTNPGDSCHVNTVKPDLSQMMLLTQAPSLYLFQTYKPLLQIDS